MALITSTNEIRVYLNISRNFVFDTLTPFIDLVELEYIVPLIGETQYNKLVVYYNSNNPDLGNTVMLKLLRMIQGAIAYYSMFEGISQVNTHVSELGIQQSYVDDKDTSRPATNQAVNKLELTYQRNGYRYSDLALQHLETNKDETEFTAWRDSTDSTITYDLLIRNKKEYQHIIHSITSLKTYKALRPYLKNAEEKYIKAVLGKTEFDALKAAIKDDFTSTTTLPDKYKALLFECQPALAYLALYEAMTYLNLEIRAESLYIVETPNTSETRKSADYRRFEALRIKTNEDGKFYLQKLKDFLNENHTDYPDFVEEGAYIKETSNCYRSNTNNEDFNSSFFV